MNKVSKLFYSAGIAMLCALPAVGVLSSCSDDKDEITGTTPEPPTDADDSTVEMKKCWECYYFLPFEKNYGNYYIELINGGAGSADGFQTLPLNPGDYILCLDFNAPLDPDHNNPKLPEGTYTSTNDPKAEHDFTFALANTLAVYNVETLESGQSRIRYIRFESGTIDVKHTDNGYSLTCDFVEKDTDKAWKFTYEGEIPLDDKSGIEDDDPWGFTGGVQFDAVVANYNFYDDSEKNGTDNYIMRFFDIDDVSADGIHPMEIGYKIQLNLHATHGAGFAGTYTIGKSSEAGYCTAGSRWGAVADGSYIEKVRDDYQVRYALLTEGTVTITDNGNGACTVNVDAKTPAGDVVKLTYNGSIEDLTNKRPVYSTLTEDVAMNLTHFNDAYYFGPYYSDNTTNYSVSLYSATQNQLIIFDIIGGANGAVDQLPTGTFTVSNTYDAFTLAEGKCIGQDITQTAFVQYDEDGIVSDFAPIAGGELTIEKVGDDYKFTFDFTDDAETPHHITGSFTTAVTIEDYTSQLQSSSLKAKRSMSAISAKH